MAAGRACATPAEARSASTNWSATGIDDTAQGDGILAATRRFHALDEATKAWRSPWTVPSIPVGGVGYLPYGNRKLPTRSTGNSNAAFLIKSGAGVGIDDNQWLAEP